MSGILLGIARHGIVKGPMEVVDHACISPEEGIAGDFRGAMKGKPYKRQVTLMELADWDVAMADLGVDHHWSVRRVNLLVGGLDLPQTKGAVLAIGGDVRLEITVECDPCGRMEAIEPGLKGALTPDWRGGACARVLAGGEIRIGDTIGVIG